MIDFSPEHTTEDIDYFLSPKAIRDRAKKLFELASSGGTHFEVRLDRLDTIAEYVKDVTLVAYPELDIPYHSRWGHFLAGNRSRLSILDDKLAHLSKEDRVRAKLDLVVISVLLDAGAGADWVFRDKDIHGDVLSIGRSEGLAIASLYLFLGGAFSSDVSNPYRVDAEGLRSLTLETLASGFQVSVDNPLVGLEGRLQLLHSLGDALESLPGYFGSQTARPGGLWDFLTLKGTRANFTAMELLDSVLRGLGSIWPGRLSLSGVPLGDVWRHSTLGGLNSLDCLVPFHKLSQWLSYSMIEPFEEAGCTVTRLDGLTGLAEYRNGGLLVDMGLLKLRDSAVLNRFHSPSSDLIVEWRALTLHTLDLLAPRVRTLLQKNEEEFPLAKVLEGGTWRAGRQVAKDLRHDQTPPIKLVSDGTVF